MLVYLRKVVLHVKQVTLTVQEALKRQVELTAEINWLRLVTGQVATIDTCADPHIRHSQGFHAQAMTSLDSSHLLANRAPASLMNALIILRNDRTYERDELSKLIDSVQITFQRA